MWILITYFVSLCNFSIVNCVGIYIWFYGLDEECEDRVKNFKTQV